MYDSDGNLIRQETDLAAARTSPSRLASSQTGRAAKLIGFSGGAAVLVALLLQLLGARRGSMMRA